MDTATHPVSTAPPAAPTPDGERTPVFVAGVTGGVGARTLTRLLAPGCSATTWPLTQPHQHADVLVTSITAAAAAWLPVALRHLHTTPVLAVVHTVPGPVPPAARARLRAAAPHVRQTLHVPYVPDWIGLEHPPGEVVPRRAAQARMQLLAAVADRGHEGN